MAAETMRFQAEVKQLLKLMIHSLYSNKEIFLRELISNASDAGDKLRFEAINDAALYENDSQLHVRVSFDAQARTLTISDNGIGMSRQEVVDHIGTIAKSGTRQFFDRLTGDQAKDAHLIGQFGVGFYSAFIIADKVTLITRRAGLTGEHGVKWESCGEGEFDLETVQKDTRGTDVILHLRDGEDEFLNDWRLRSIIRKYSDHIVLPIEMQKTAAPHTAEEAPTDDVIDVPVWETVNQANALWTRTKNDISAEQYEEFYKHVGHDFEAPLAHVHAKVEGKQEYTLLLYLPQRAPFDLWDRERKTGGVKLYVQRVFIMDDAQQLMPQYLRFIKGVIDSSDLPLNVSREILQQSKDIEQIRAGATKKVLAMIENLAANEPEKFTTVWQQFGRVLKEGMVEDHANKEKVAKLLRFASTHHDNADETVSLTDYVGRMKEGQDKIYYITAESFAAAKNSPHLEIFRKKGIEVLLMADRVDEWMMSSFFEFEGKKLQSVAKGDLDLGSLEDETEKAEQQKQADSHKALIEKIQTTLGDKVKEVRVTHRLTNSPACLVSEEHGMSINLERLLKAAGQSVAGSKPILEINPTHPLVNKIEAEMAGERFNDWVHILFDQAWLAEGAQLEDPASFVQRLNSLMLALSH